MRKRLTLKYIKNKFEEDGYILISTEYINAHKKLEYLCSNNHYGSMSWNTWQQGHRCNKCYRENNFGENHPNWQGGDIIKVCPVCKEKFIAKSSNKNQRCCSTKCMGEWQSENLVGELASHWNPNLTDEERLKNRSRTGSKEYVAWRKAVFKRDNYICQVCGDNGRLNAHHLEGYANNPDLRFILKNGITLCKKHHDEFHNKYGRGNNTKIQFIEFCKNF